MLTCQFAKDVWRSIKLSFNIKLDRREFMSPKFWLFSFLSQAMDVEATVLAVGCWHIWEARNNARNNKSDADPRRTSAKVLAYVEMIIENCYKRKPFDHRREPKVVLKWSPPPSGEFLINVDAALFEDLGRMSMGMVVRDHEGKCLAAASVPLQGFSSPELAEAMALRQAMEIANEKGFVNVIFASDCLSVIQRLNKPRTDRSDVGLVLKDIKVLAEGFSSVSFKHVRRSLNEAAHLLARSCDLASLGFISDFALDLIRETLCNYVK
jgi:ribonuclease HI